MLMLMMKIGNKNRKNGLVSDIKRERKASSFSSWPKNEDESGILATQKPEADTMIF